MGRSELIYTVIIIGIAMVILSVVMPLGLNTIATTNTSTWDTGVASMFSNLLPIVVMFAIILGFIGIYSMKNKQ